MCSGASVLPQTLSLLHSPNVQGASMLWPSLVATFLMVIIPFEENCVRLQLNTYRTLAGSMGEHRLAKDQAAAGECIGDHGGEKVIPFPPPMPIWELRSRCR